MPTILKLVNEDAPKYLDGIDLGPMVHGEPTQRRILFSDTWRYNGFAKLEVDQSAAFDGARKFVYDRLTGGIYYENQAARSQVQTAASWSASRPSTLSRAQWSRTSKKPAPSRSPRNNGRRTTLARARGRPRIRNSAPNAPSVDAPHLPNPQQFAPDLQKSRVRLNWGVGCCIGRSC